VLIARFNRLWETVVKRGLAHGFLPFDWGAYRSCKQAGKTMEVGTPVTFSEKVRYKIRQDRRPILKTYADKLAVRDYVTSLCSDVTLPRLLSVHNSATDAARAIPPDPWVMKGSHGSGMILISDHTTPRTKAQVRRHAHEWLRTDYSLKHWEWQYHRLPRRIMFEEHLGDGRGVPHDYKLYVIHQKVRFLEIDQGRYSKHTRDFFYPDWTPIRSRIGPAPVAAQLPGRPEHLNRMLSIASALARDTDFLRVDLYEVRGDVYFGELTHSPAAGNFGFADRGLDEELGRGWVVPNQYRELTTGGRLVPSFAPSVANGT
jgi:hypothetical protein